jgi:hypothetical protein
MYVGIIFQDVAADESMKTAYLEDYIAYIHRRESSKSWVCKTYVFSLTNCNN